jgi:hypothetical protein
MAAASVPATIVKKQTSSVAIIALIGAGLALILAAAALAATRKNRPGQEPA